jgi:UDP-N-acetylglucosamine 2-epimerase
MEEFLLHTGQHYDQALSEVFFEELEIAAPDLNLGIGSGPHGWQTGQMLAGIEGQIEAWQPDFVLVYGDTNSTLAGALAAVKLHVPVAHVEAGLRSFNRQMPEEINRLLTDHCAELLFCPTRTAVQNLEREGILSGVHRVGDVMYDAALHFSDLASEQSGVLDRFSLSPGGYLLATIHRPYNTDDPHRLRRILAALGGLEERVIFPIHPRTRQRISELGIDLDQLAGNSLQLTDPVGYLDMLTLERNARMIITDSGGVQKEAYFLAVPCLTLRPETEWVETLEHGWNRLVWPDPEALLELTRMEFEYPPRPQHYGDGHAAEAVATILRETG